MDVGGLGRGLPASAAPATLAPRKRRRQRIGWLAAVVVALLVLGALLLRSPGPRPDTAPPRAAAARVTTTPIPRIPSGLTAAPLPSSATPITPPTTEPLPAPGATAVVERRSAQQAVDALQGLRVAGRAPKTGYSRAQFGDAWTDDVAVDLGHNGCDTRNDVLRRDLAAITIRAGSHGCVVTAGTLADPYTGRVLPFSAGRATTVQIDHVVALSDAWQNGAAALSPQQRQELANDPLNLQATASAVNQAKGDGDAATWLPPEKSYRCTYVARQVAVKAKYALWVTTAERQAIWAVLTGCGATAATPTGHARTAATSRATPTPVQHPSTAPQPVSPEETATQSLPSATTADAGGTYYRSCAQARAAGAAPLHRGEPGYRAGLDGDDDGIACE